ncbi:MAG: hypothetical protein ACPGVS_03340, partial [Primorskyibacter sp.]
CTQLFLWIIDLSASYAHPHSLWIILWRILDYLSMKAKKCKKIKILEDAQHKWITLCEPI